MSYSVLFDARCCQFFFTIYGIVFTDIVGCCCLHFLSRVPFTQAGGRNRVGVDGVLLAEGKHARQRRRCQVQTYIHICTYAKPTTAVLAAYLRCLVSVDPSSVFRVAVASVLPEGAADGRGGWKGTLLSFWSVGKLRCPPRARTRVGAG